MNAPDILFAHLALVYRSWLYHGTVSINLLSCAFLPLLKSSLKNPSDINAYRAIAGSSLILKLFDQVVLMLWGHYMLSDSLQFGYKQGFSTTQCSWLVMEVASYFLRKGTPCILTLLDCTKAFDKCKFDIMFKKLLDRKMPLIVVRVLIFVYQEQWAWVRWGQARSRSFSVVNGTRQGSVLSPAIFSVYMDDLIGRLRKSGVGCYLGNVFCGVVGYADDILLLAPSRSAMVQMLRICESYAEEHNLQFSTDADPIKSKSKCIFMKGTSKRQNPVNLQLYGVDLPWVESASHLGNTLSNDCKMDIDMKQKRADFIARSTEVRECFGFAFPNQVLQAVKTYCCGLYGAMLWPLFSDKATEVFNSWNTCVKLAWGLPRSTHRYFVDNLLSGGLPSMKNSTISCFLKFHESLIKSPSLELRVLSNIVTSDQRSTTGANMHGVRKMCDKDPLETISLAEIKKMLLESRTTVPNEDKWRIPCLVKFLEERYLMQSRHQDHSELDEIIDSLCST